MLLTTSSPRQFVNGLTLLRVLFLLCACSSRDVSLYPPTWRSNNIPGRTSAPANSLAVSVRQAVLASGISLQSGAWSYRVNGEPTWLVNGVLRADAVTSSIRQRMLSQATPVVPVPTRINISISPARACLAPNQTLQFTAAVRGMAHHAVRWFVEGHEGGDASVGTVSATGVYTAPPVPTPWPSVTVTAVSAHESEVFASSVVTMMPAPRDEQR
jgi:hypothetical protein